MSPRTLPALRACMQSRPSRAYWIDVLCVPATGPARQATLESMGYIYSLAAEVVVVLEEASFLVLRAMTEGRDLTTQDLQLLEKDAWVSSVWTYQEIVNSKRLYIVNESQDDAPLAVEGLDFLNSLGGALMKWKATRTAADAAVLATFPHLNFLEDVIADWIIADYTGHSAFTVFSRMAQKRNADPANFFYAMIGTLTRSPAELAWDGPVQALPEKLLAICERRNDYSFIYTIGPRDPRLRWRPSTAGVSADGDRIPAMLQPILVWHCFGEAQRAHRDAAGFWLDSMAVLTPSETVGAAAKIAIANWLSRLELEHAEQSELLSSVCTIAAEIGFANPKDPILVEEGFVFLQETDEAKPIGRLLISTQIRWAWGSPGLVEFGSGDAREYAACAFFGNCLGLKGESVLLLD